LQGQNCGRDENVANEKSEVGVERATQSTDTAAVPPATTIHEAELAPSPSGAVEYGKQIESMKFFTPDLIDTFGSEDDGIAVAAQQEFEGRSEEYLRQLHEIEVKLPERFRELLAQFYLHDSRVN